MATNLGNCFFSFLAQTRRPSCRPSSPPKLAEKVDTVGTFNLKQNKRMSQRQSHSFHWFPSKKKLAKELGQNSGPGSICEEVVTGTVVQ